MSVRKCIVQFLLLFYVFLYIYGQAVGNKVIIALAIVVALLPVIFYPPKGWRLFLYSFIVAILSLIILLFNNTYPFERLVFNVAFLFANIMLAMVLSREHKFIPELLRTIIYGLFAFIFVCFILSIIKKVHIYVFMNSLLVGFSYNYISGLLVLSLSVYFSYYAKFGKDVKYGSVFAFLSVIACALLYGRSGIIFSFMLFFIYFKGYLNPSKGMRFYFIMICCCLLLAYGTYNISLLTDAVQNSKFREGIQSPRFTMLHEYFNALNINALIMGVDITKLPTVASFNFNPHNSFVNLHAMTGILCYGAIVLIFLKLFNLSFFNLNLLMYLSLYLLRGAFDTIILPGVFDFIFLFLLFYKHQDSFNICTHKEKKC